MEVVVKVAKVLHAATFYPLMTVIYRQQLIGGILRGCGFSVEGGGYMLTFAANLLMVGATSLATGFYPQLNKDDINPTILLRYVGAICGVIYSVVRLPVWQNLHGHTFYCGSVRVQVLPLMVHIMVVSTHSRFNTGRFTCYGLLLLFGSVCLLLQVRPFHLRQPPYWSRICIKPNAATVFARLAGRGRVTQANRAVKTYCSTTFRKTFELY